MQYSEGCMVLGGDRLREKQTCISFIECQGVVYYMNDWCINTIFCTFCYTMNDVLRCKI